VGLRRYELEFVLHCIASNFKKAVHHPQLTIFMAFLVRDRASSLRKLRAIVLTPFFPPESVPPNPFIDSLMGEDTQHGCRQFEDASYHSESGSKGMGFTQPHFLKAASVIGEDSNLEPSATEQWEGAR
jgi:hypothetical protein